MPDRPLHTARPSRRSFTALVRAQALAQHLVWGWRETITVLTIPLILLAGWMSGFVSRDPVVQGLLDTGLRTLAFAFLVVANAAVLARHWRAFCAAPWRSALLVLAGLIAIPVITTVVAALPGLSGAASAPDQGHAADAGAAAPALGLLLLFSMGPTLTALIEDFVFRHTLLLKLPLWHNLWLATAACVLNALVFGAIHLHNFGGHWLPTLSYAAVGLFMNLVYLWTRNIWHVLLMHGLNNFLLAGPPVVLLAHLLTPG